MFLSPLKDVEIAEKNANYSLNRLHIIDGAISDELHYNEIEVGRQNHITLVKKFP